MIRNLLASACLLGLFLASCAPAFGDENMGMGADVSVVVERAQPQSPVVEGVGMAAFIASIASSLVIGFFIGITFVKKVRPRTWYRYEKQAGGRGGEHDG